MTKKNKILLVVMILTLVNGLMIYRSLTSLTSSRDAQSVAYQISDARKAIEKLPPGMGRVNDFIRRLKAVDPGYAPPEVKEALKEYTKAMEQAAEAMTNHQNYEELQRICADKAETLRHTIDSNR